MVAITVETSFLIIFGKLIDSFLIRISSDLISTRTPYYPFCDFDWFLRLGVTLNSLLINVSRVTSLQDFLLMKLSLWSWSVLSIVIRSCCIAFDVPNGNYVNIHVLRYKVWLLIDFLKNKCCGSFCLRKLAVVYPLWMIYCLPSGLWAVRLPMVLSIITKTYFNLHREGASSIDSKGHLPAM